MPDAFKMRTRQALEVALVLTPWVVSMYTLYWLQYGEIWTTATPHRSKISVAILAVGMGLSFLVHSHFAKPEQK